MTHAPPIVPGTLNTAVDTVLEVPRFAVGGHLPGRRLSRYPAGKGLNVSRALARVGCPSTVTGFVGRDEAALFRRFLLQDTRSLADSRLTPVDGSTRQNITILDPATHTDTHLREAGFTVTHADLRRLRARLLRLATPGAVAAFSGSLPPGLHVPDFANLLDTLAYRGVCLVLDTGGDLLRHVLLAPSSAQHPLLMIKPNLAELAELLAQGLPVDETELVQLVRPLTERVRWIAVTRGARGAILVSRADAGGGNVEVDPAQVVSTVGCGDCMLAGLLAGYAEAAPPAEMLRRGLSVATANTFLIGAATFEPQRVGEITARVRLRKL